ncbi:MAG: lysylphosphatidylglycerol synthase transmembrane domain-containing protein [Capnocytophaga sp.]|nr:lysylphosphatidylglycerol synthase transmembrane domain-containing protein [Capnocytophaga sp.]
MKKKTKKILSTVLKIGVSIALLWFVYTKISVEQLVHVFGSSHIGYLLLAIGLYLVSQFVSAKRLLLYFHQNGYLLGYRTNLVLYFVGMFYNFFIPGGIGGDAYKVFLLNRHYGWRKKTLASAVLADRASGLLAICCWLLLGVLFVDIQGFTVWKWTVPFLLFGGIFFSKMVLQKLFPSYNPLFFKSLIYSLIVQGLQLLCVWAILKGLRLTDGYAIYLLMFLASSVLSLFSFSGIGVREYIFLKAAQWFDFNEEISVSVGLAFSVIVLICSLPGIVPALAIKKFVKKINDA